MDRSLARFPSGCVMSDAEAVAIELNCKLLDLLGELNNRVYNYWERDKSCRQLWKASGELVRCCISISAPIVRFKRLVLTRSSPYWLERHFLSDDLKCFLVSNTDGMVTHLVHEVEEAEAAILRTLYKGGDNVVRRSAAGPPPGGDAGEG